jgi:surface polysaccharide O-acyltransferase-like enzyme
LCPPIYGQVANLLAMVLVILIHYNTRGAIANASAANPNYFLQQFLANGVGRAAVPLFALAAGFFFLNYSGTASYVRNLKKRIRTLFVPYFVVSTAMAVGFLVVRALVRGNYNVRPLDTIAEIVLRPRSAQFWFLRDLMVLVLISPAIHFLVRTLREFWVVVLGWPGSSSSRSSRRYRASTLSTSRPYSSSRWAAIWSRASDSWRD